MSFVERVLRKSFIKSYQLFCIMFSCFLFICSMGVLSFLNFTGIICLLGLILPITIYIILRFLCIHIIINKGIERVNHKFKKEVEKVTNYETFCRDIECEMREEETIQYFNEISSSGVLMTRKWFVFISSSIIVIKKTVDIYSITEHVRTNSSGFLVSFQFKDNTFFNTDNIEFTDFEPLVRKKYPTILLDKGIE